MKRIADRLVLLTTFAVGVALSTSFKQQPTVPTSFEVRVAAEPTLVRAGTPLTFNCGTLIVSVDHNGGLAINGVQEYGTIQESGALSETLTGAFHQRTLNRAYDPALIERAELPIEERIYKTVVIKASPTLSYGDVLKVVDAVKGTGAKPIALQTDELEGESRSFYGALDDGNDHPLRRLTLATSDF